MQQVAYLKHAKQSTSKRSEQLPIVPKPPTKKLKHYDPTMTLLQCIMPGKASVSQQKRAMTPHEQAEDKIATHKKLAEEKWPTFEKTLEWWSCRNTR